MTIDFSKQLKEPEVITATYRIVTPMFIGDAQQKATGISPASVKGALRFWWRALNWGRIRVDKSSDADALKQLHEEEGCLYGTATDKGKASLIRLQLDTSSVSSQQNSDWPISGNDPSGYLGMGLWKTGTTPAREYITEKQSFKLLLIFNKTDLRQEQLEQIKDTLLAWGLFGGLGSRSRRAFGSVAIENINSENYQFNNIEAYQKIVGKLFKKYCYEEIAETPFSSLNNETIISISKNLEGEARKIHATLGQSFKDYRGQPSDLRGAKKKVFGLPLTDVSEERRASPLLFHIHPIGEQQFTSTVLFLPAEFHHNSKLNAVNYSLAKNFLDKQATSTVIV